MSSLYHFTGDAKLDLDVSGTLYAGETVNASCTFTGENKPRFIRISGLSGPQCKVDRMIVAGPSLQQANYVNNFKITCSKSSFTFDLKCSTSNEMINKSIQGKIIQHFKYYNYIQYYFIYSDIQAKDSQSSSQCYCY